VRNHNRHPQPIPKCPRNKDLKNPRKKHRIKFAQAQVRLKGAVQTVRTGEAGGYAGEPTGIKSRLAKGRKLG
jgi:hypothetical protein